MKQSRATIRSFTMQEWVLMALLAAANGAVTSLLSHVNKLLSAWGGSILTSTITGIYMVYGLLAMYIIRKPGSSLVTYSIGALMQIMVGTAYGAWAAIAAALSYAVVAELLFYIFRHRQFGWITMLFTGTALVPLWFIIASFMFGYIEYAPSILVITLVVRCISGMLLCGALTKWIGDKLTGTRYVRAFAISRSDHPVH